MFERGERVEKWRRKRSSRDEESHSANPQLCLAAFQCQLALGMVKVRVMPESLSSSSNLQLGFGSPAPGADDTTSPTTDSTTANS